MHGFVRHKFEGKNSKGQPSVSVLLDWNGRIAQEYGFDDELTNVYLIDASGVLRYRSAGKGTATEIQQLMQAAKTLDADPPR